MFAFMKRFLEKLAKENEEQFQGQAPDCCTINKPETQTEHCAEKREKR